MGTIAEKLTYLNTTKGKIKDSINLTGANIGSNDTFRSYAVKLRDGLVNVLNNGTIVLYNNFPKVSGTGSSINLSNTLEAPMNINKLDGDTLQHQIVPSEYTQVDYIESSGTQYIDTEIIGKKNIKTYADINLVQLESRNTPIFGSYGNNSRCYLGIMNSAGLLGYSYGTTTWGETSISANQRNVIEIDFTQNSQSMKLNGTTILTTTNSLDLNTNKNIYIPGYNNDGTFDTRYPISVKLYRYKIYDGNTLIRDFVPCYRNSDNEIGLYDIVNNVFYTNQGTGSFTYGSVVPTPDSPLEIQSVEGIQTITIGDGTDSDTYEVNLEGKNLFNEVYDNIDTTIRYKSIYVGNGKFTASSSIPLTTPNNVATIFFLAGQVTNGASTNTNGVYLNRPITVESVNGYVTIAYRIYQTYNPENYKTQIELGEVATSYVPYRSPIKLYNGDYITGTLDNWSIVKNNAVIDSYNGETITTDYISTTGGLDTGATIVYKLDTPTTTSITDTYLISQLNALYNAKSYNGQTNITVDGQLPMILEVSALKDEI